MRYHFNVSPLQIPTIVVNRKENKLRKGAGYHLDLFVLGMLSLVTGMLGKVETSSMRRLLVRAFTV